MSLVALLGIPLTLGLWVSHRWPALTARIRKPLGQVSVLALILFIIAGLIQQRQLLTLGLLPTLLLVVLHNALGLTLGWITATLMRLSERDRRAVVIEGGMQNSGLALGIIAV